LNAKVTDSLKDTDDKYALKIDTRKALMKLEANVRDGLIC
jgi:hypothetical protein